MGRSVSVAAVATVYQTTLTTSGTWIKDASIQDNDDVDIYLVAGGGGGYNGNPGGGGQGGDGALFKCKGRDLLASMDAIIGAGGNTSQNGGDTSLGGAVVVKGGKSGSSAGNASNASVNPGIFAQWSTGGLGSDGPSPGGNSPCGGGGGASGTLERGKSLYAGQGGTANGDIAEIPGGGGGRGQPGKRGHIKIIVTRG